MNKKINKSLLLIIVLIVALLGTCGYIVYDKLLNNNKIGDNKIIKHIKEETVMNNDKFELELFSNGKLYLKHGDKKEKMADDVLDVYTCDIGQASTYAYIIDKNNDVYEVNIEEYVSNNIDLSFNKIPYNNIVAVANIGFNDAMHAVFIDKKSNGFINDLEITDYKDENNYAEYLDRMTDYFSDLFDGNEYFNEEYIDNILLEDEKFIMNDNFNIVDTNGNIVFEDADAIWKIKFGNNKNYIYVLDDDGNLLKAKTDEYINGNSNKLVFNKVNFKNIKKVLETEINDKNYAVLIDINNKAYVINEFDELYK